MRIGLSIGIPAGYRLGGGGASDPLLFRLTPGTPVSGQTFSRSTTGTFFDVNGVLQTAEVDEVRGFQYGRNFLTQSNVFTNGAWVKTTATLTTGIADPDGGTNATTLTATAVNSNVYQQTTMRAGTDTGSLRIRRRTGTGAVSLITASGSRVAQTITGAWQQFTATATGNANPFWGVELATSGDAVDIYHAQLERGTTATTYIDTTTTALSVIQSGNGGSHYVGGVPTILLEGGRTNSVLWSRDLTNAAWTLAGTGTRTQNAVGLDGTANSATTVADTDAAGGTYLAQNITVPVDSNTHVQSYYVKKDTDQTRFPLLYAVLTGGTVGITRSVSLNTQTGAFTTQDVAGTGTTRVVDGGLFWVVEIALTNNPTALNTTLRSIVYPAYSTVIGVYNAAATGSCVVGQVQVELNSGFYSSPIFTTTAAVSRGSDIGPYYPYSYTGDQTIYIKGVNLGTANSAAGLYYLSVGTGTTAPRIAVYLPSANALALYEANGTTAVGPQAATTAAIGDTLEARVVVSSATALAGSSVNGAAESTGSVAGIAAPSAWSANRVNLGGIDTGANEGFFAFTSVKIATGVKTMAEMRAL